MCIKACSGCSWLKISTLLCQVTCGRRTIRLRTKQSGNAYDWVTAINHAGLGPSEGWCRPHRYGSFAPPRGDHDDASEAQWFIDGKAAYHAIASAIEHAKSEVCKKNLL